MRDKNKNNKTVHERLQQYIDAIQFFDESLDEYIYIYDLTSERVFLTDRIREKYPIPPADDNGNDFKDWNDIVYPKDRELMDHYRELMFEGKIKSFNIAYRIMDRAGNKVWIRVKGALREKDDTQSLLLVGRISEMTSDGMIDRLTGLCGPEKLMEDMQQHLASSDGYLMVLDLDNFKNLNLSQGRPFCDNILKKVAAILDEHARYPMELYRMEGDCFAVNFIQKQREDVVTFYSAIKKSLEQICSFSAGVVNYHHTDAPDSSALYLYAENALDQAKREGKNRLVFFSEEDYQRNLKQIELVAELKNAVEHQFAGFHLEYQPQISGRDFSLYGLEALIRYESPSRGRISPEEFIPILEQTGLICPVGRWVLQTAVAQCVKWRGDFPDLHMSINMSYVQLNKNCVTDMVLDTLEKAGLPGDALTLELTESVQLQNYDHFNKIFYQWKQRGIRISIDDFGTGYSSLSYLKRIEIDEVKIDRCFVEHVQYNSYNFHLLSNMIELAHSAKIDVCCEGVETMEELMALQQLHTDLHQGFFFSKPCTVSEFERLYLIQDSQEYQERVRKEKELRSMESNEIKKRLEELCSEEVGNITESMDEIVYVSDPDTYELYYLNGTGRRLTGVYDYKGQKCYKVLQGRQSPCEFCTNSQICKDRFLIWERENKFLNKHFLLKDKLIPWKGKMARVEIAVDITEKEILSQQIQKRLHFERAILDSCRILVSEPKPEQAVYQVLKIMVEFCQGTRAYIIKPDDDGSHWTTVWEWRAENGAVPKEDSADRLEQEALKITHPIMRAGRTVGFIGIDNPSNTETGRELVKTMAYFLGYTIVGETKQLPELYD